MAGRWFCLSSGSSVGAVKHSTLALLHVSWASHSMLARVQESEGRNYQSHKVCTQTSQSIASATFPWSKWSQGQPGFTRQANNLCLLTGAVACTCREGGNCWWLLLEIRDQISKLNKAIFIVSPWGPHWAYLNMQINLNVSLVGVTWMDILM